MAKAPEKCNLYPMSVKKALAVLPVLAVVVLAAWYFGLDFLVRHGIETVGPSLTGTTVEVEDVDLSVFDGRGSIRGLVIGNPRGFQSKYAFKLHQVRIQLVPRSLFGDKIVIREIYVDSPDINYEKKDDTSNLERLVKNIQASVGGGTGGDTDLGDLADQLTGSRKLQIDHFVLKDAKVRFHDQSLNRQGLGIPPLSLELHGLGTRPGGATVSEVSAKVMKKVSTRAGLAVTAQMLTLGMAQDGGEGRRRVSESPDGAHGDEEPHEE
jgi:hypothetical protein